MLVDAVGAGRSCTVAGSPCVVRDTICRHFSSSRLDMEKIMTKNASSNAEMSAKMMTHAPPITGTVGACE